MSQLLTIKRRRTFSFAGTFYQTYLGEDNPGNVPVNLTGGTLRAQIRETKRCKGKKEAKVIANLNPIAPSPANGVITIDHDRVFTTTLPEYSSSDAEWDLIYTDPSGLDYTLVPTSPVQIITPPTNPDDDSSDDFVPGGGGHIYHVHPISQVTGLQAVLDGLLPIADLATQAEAEAGADNTKWMSPLRVKQAIDELTPPSAGGVWGSITGNLSDQTDLATALSLKANTSSLGYFATGTDAANLTGTLAPARIADASLPTAKTIGLTAALANTVNLTGNQTVNGTKEFSALLIDGVTFGSGASITFNGGSAQSFLSAVGLTGATTDILVGGGLGVAPVWTTATGTGAPVRASNPTFTGTINGADLNLTGGIAIASNASFLVSGRSQIASPINGATIFSTTSGATGFYLNYTSNGLVSFRTVNNSGFTSISVLNLTASGTIKTGVFTVATLPAAGTAGAGAQAFVTDATATTFMSTVVGGGTNAVPVVSDGTNWKIG